MAIGLLAQAFFSARILVQWILSERAHKVLSPSAFWILSLAGSYLLCLYGWLRMDFSIVFGQFISYYIYIWNLYMKGEWKVVPRVLRYVLYLTPVAVLCYVLSDAQHFIDRFLHNEDVPALLLIYGSIGQLLFTLRFVYQWAYSSRKSASVLPVGFWIISLIGSSIIFTYGIIRLDIVLMAGHAMGLVAYSRNLYIGYKQEKGK